MGGFLTESFFFTGDRKKAQTDFDPSPFIEFSISTRGIKGGLGLPKLWAAFPDAKR
jgi:hypothetical protein